MNRGSRIVLLVSATALLLVLCYGQGKRPMTLVDMLEVPTLGDPQLSPDGTQVLYVVGKADWNTNNRVSHIWRINLGGSGTVQMTNGPRGDSSPRWSPDGSLIAFISRRGSAAGEGTEEPSQIFTMSTAGGEAQQLTKHATAVSNLSWSPAGDALYFLAPDPKTPEQKEREKAKDDVYTFDENYQQNHLWKYTLADSKETRLTQGDYSIMSYSLSRDGTKIAVMQAPSPLIGDQELSEVYVMDSTGKNVVQLTRNRVEESNVEISPDNTQVLFLCDANQNFDTYYDRNLFIVPAAGGPARLVIPDFRYGIEAARWSKDGKSLYLMTNMGVHTELETLDPATGKVTQLTSGEHALGGWTFSEKSNRHIFTLSDPSSPGEVYTMGLNDSAPARVTHVYDYFAGFKLPRMEKVQWKGDDGVTVEGVLTYPLDYQEGHRYPLAVCTHGGPQSADRMTLGSWSTYKPVLAAKGYAVFQPNYRGSTGYGNDFMRDMVGHYFRHAHLDVMTGVDYLIQRGIADPDRMVKMGWSAGGHMTDKIITFTDRFKAASAGAGAANWISMYAQSDVRTYRTPWFGGTPWQKDAPIAVYWDNSPLKDAWKVKTPTIFLVGERDVRVPMPQSVEMYRALKSNGIPTHLYVAPREPHGWGELRHELFKMNIELEWFEKYATKRPYVWEKAPATEEEKPKVTP